MRAYLAVGLTFVAAFGLFLFLTYFLQNVRGMSPVRTGVAFLPLPVDIVLASTLANLLGNGLEPSWMTEHSARLAKVTVDEVSAAAAQFFGPARFVGVVVGDASRIVEPLSALTSVITSAAE